MADTVYTTSTKTVLILLFCLLGLVFLLIFLYKKLNREANGEYTVQRMVYKEGGVRDQVRGAALAAGTRLGVNLWPRSATDDGREEMQEVHDEEGQVEEGYSQGSDSARDDQEEEDNEEQCGKTKGQGSDASDDHSSLEGSEAGEQARLMDEPQANGGTLDKGEERVGDVEGKGEASGGAGLLIDLKQFSGSAIWSEEDRGECKDSDVTAL
ncbi:uncharacterized protein [Pempheris klunzingeri]|uniref:uncharacterized protein n=1 Tax=Pempheris klunzingeri TaxID=3127111 RepID=UPI00397FA2A5